MSNWSCYNLGCTHYHEYSKFKAAGTNDKNWNKGFFIPLPINYVINKVRYVHPWYCDVIIYPKAANTIQFTPE